MNPFGIAPPVGVLLFWLRQKREPVIECVFVCPACGHGVQPQNLLCVACANCGLTGTKDHFSAVVKKAA